MKSVQTKCLVTLSRAAPLYYSRFTPVQNERCFTVSIEVLKDLNKILKMESVFPYYFYITIFDNLPAPSLLFIFLFERVLKRIVAIGSNEQSWFLWLYTAISTCNQS